MGMIVKLGISFAVSCVLTFCITLLLTTPSQSSKKALVYYEYVETRGTSTPEVEIDESNCVLCREPNEVLLRTRKLMTDGPKPYYKTILESATYNPAKTAVVSIDMWDNHWCPVDKARAMALAPIVNMTLNAARARGMQIVHAPADVLGFYKDHPARKRTRRLSLHCSTKELKKNIIKWNPPKLPAYKLTNCPNEGAKARLVWTRINPDIYIDDYDLMVNPDGKTEMFCLLHKLNIDTIIYVGIQSNYCVTNRPAGMMKARKYGFKTIIVPQATQCNNDPSEPPYLNYDQACDIVIKFIESHIATEGSLINPT